LFNSHPEWSSLGSTTSRFIRLDPEANYRSTDFLAWAHSYGYKLEHTPPRDKHAGGIAERAVGVISMKTNTAMLTPIPPVPKIFWDLAMTYTCVTQSFCYNVVIGTSPYNLITKTHVNIRHLQPFWSTCYVHIPLADRYSKIGSPRAYRARFVGYHYSSTLEPVYKVLQVYPTGVYGTIRISKDVIFDSSIDLRDTDDSNIPDDLLFLPTTPGEPTTVAAPSTQLVAPPHTVPPPIIVTSTVQPDETDPVPDEEDINNINDHYDEDGILQYWYRFTVNNHEFPLSMVETTHNMFIMPVKDSRVPRTYRQAMNDPVWAQAVETEKTKFRDNEVLLSVPFTGQHLVPMMWLFSIKTDGKYKARLVGRGDLMKPWIDFDPYALYCGNVSACSIKIALTIAAKYKLTMRGGDLEGAYLVTRANKDFPVHIRTPEGYHVEEGDCIQAVGNLYGFPPAGQNFSIEFDKCVKECGYTNTPWDLKFFFKWVKTKPILLIAHSDDFRWFGPEELLSEWDQLVTTFNQHRYKVTDATQNEFVGLRITRDTHFNYYMDQTRMIKEIVREANITGAKDEHLPYPTQEQEPPLSKEDNARDDEKAECLKYPYRRVVGQLMYGMVHSMVCIMYALNILSRYSNNPGPRHIKFLKHLLKYVKYSQDDRLMFATHSGPTDKETMTQALQLRFQCDADLGGNPDNKHSQTSFLGYLGGSLICWCSTDQGSISTSTAESEIKAVNHTLKAEVIANRGILNSMGWTQDPTIIEEDNAACVFASNALHMTRGLRHLDLTESWIKEKVADKTCILLKVESKNNNSDIGTKRVPLSLFNTLTYQLVDRSLRKNL
jgi:hypothetical protein